MPSPPSSSPRIFLSYARTDLEHALALRAAIEAELGAGTVWHDVRNLAGDHWWTEIEDAIRGKAAVEHLVLLASAQALAPERRVVRDEWRLAQREGKTVTNVFWSAHPAFTPPAFGALPDWIKAKSMLDLSLPDRMQALIDTLKQPGQGPRRPFMAPSLPDGFVQRSAEFAQLKSALLDAQGDAVAITAALRGAGGFGKTVLATALARDDDIQDAFHDGILWVTLGDRPSLAQVISDLITAIGPERVAFAEVSTAANRLKELLDKRRCLLVIDDAWQQGHLRPLLDGAPGTTRLVTTRRDDILAAGVTKVIVDAMQGAEAVELLARGLGDVGAADTAALAKLGADRLGEWPILLSLVNGFLRARVERGEALTLAIGRVTERLDRRGLNAFNRALENERTAAIDSTVGASLDLLAEFDQGGRPTGFHANRYNELAVFPEDTEIPIATVARLWGRIGDVDDLATEELLERLYGLALLQALDLKKRTVRLHDVMRTYLGERAGTEAMPALHRHVVSAYDDKSGPDIEDPEERQYFFEQYPSHLAAADEREALDALLLDPQWMQRKLDAMGGPLPLVVDYERLGRGQMQGLIGRTLRLTSGMLSRDGRQLLAQLHGRLMACEVKGAPRFLRDVLRQLACPAILTQRPSLKPPGAEYARLEGHSMPVWALALSSGGRLASGSNDHTIRLWDLDSGVESARLVGHESVVSALAALPCGHLASGSDDNTIRLWDLNTGAETARLEGHTNLVRALAVLPDGRLASGSWDNTIGLDQTFVPPGATRWAVAARIMRASCERASGAFVSIDVGPVPGPRRSAV